VILKKLDYELPETVAPVASATLIGGVLFLVVEYWLRQRPSARKSPGRSPWRLISQLVAAVFPAHPLRNHDPRGVDAGTEPPGAAEFFLLGIPTLLAAGACKPSPRSRSRAACRAVGHDSAGSLAAALTAFVVEWLLRFVQTHTFVGFACAASRSASCCWRS
jgi:undecaprenyl-diphosphatase